MVYTCLYHPPMKLVILKGWFIIVATCLNHMNDDEYRIWFFLSFPLKLQTKPSGPSGCPCFRCSVSRKDGKLMTNVFLNYCGKAKTKIIPSSLPEKGGKHSSPIGWKIIGVSWNMVYIWFYMSHVVNPIINHPLKITIFMGGFYIIPKC